jgi:uncharacterized protein YndB with AHSA1/START domain
MEWTGQVYADTPTVVVQTYIQAPPERVWALVSDIHLMPRLSTELREVEWLDGVTGPAVGHRFMGRNAHQALGNWETVSTVVECDEPRRFRQGWADVAAQVRERWQSGDRDGAAGLVTDEMVLATTLIGTEDMVRARLRTWRDTGVDTVRLYPAGDTLAARLDNLGRGIDLVRALGPG